MNELEVYGKLVSPLRPVLAFTRTATSFKLSWTAGTLESSAEVNGPYSNVQNAVSPFDVVLSANRRFYRLKQ